MSLYFYHATRLGKVVEKIIGDYSGYLQTDGYPAYNAADEGFKNMPIGEIGDKRQNALKPLLDEYWKFLDTIQAANGSNPDKAVNYSLNHKKHLNNVLLDNCMELTNNRAEGAVKPFVIGRKNWLFSDTAKGADASARCYSIVESDKLNNLNVFSYLTHLLTELPKLDDKLASDQLDNLMPWSDSLSDYCK